MPNKRGALVLFALMATVGFLGDFYAIGRQEVGRSDGELPSYVQFGLSSKNRERCNISQCGSFIQVGCHPEADGPVSIYEKSTGMPLVQCFGLGGCRGQTSDEGSPLRQWEACEPKTPIPWPNN